MYSSTSRLSGTFQEAGRSAKECTRIGKLLWALPMMLAITITFLIVSNLPLIFNFSGGEGIIGRMRLEGFAMPVCAALPFLWPIARIYGQRAFIAGAGFGLPSAVLQFLFFGITERASTAVITTSSITLIAALAIGSALVQTMRRRQAMS